MGEMGFDGGGDEGKGVAARLAAGFDSRQHRLNEAAAAGALRPERQLPPYYCMTQRTLARIVRRLDSFVPQKRPQPRAMLVQLPTRPTHVAIFALHSAPQLMLDLPTNRTHPTHQCGARDRARAIV